ncbi:hypothetical protein M438DRAFT_346730 [Aureobasidium pullulans EXF-150]|uniref:CCHC-type domain-containing protein n=1 Tax=Aureobasidium pullulans EXF-150 TaxID=1043002 RepID=A0A074Y8B5_AURPU|nr:uncharacterized protein M438DRAFT_346730 [Aureobasidium pullulans EXF-150]KEQ83091.1 hypothetical protein M438DRAFT_346730 [Aureobasidium pullulans EXF-150]
MSGKNMSSRLLNMKFMQRASASTPTTPTTPDGTRPSKRQRTEAAVDPDVRAFQEAAAAEEAKKNAFIERAAAEAGETKWVLSVSDDKPQNTASSLRIVEAGYGAIDSGAPIPESDDEEEEQSAGMAGRRSFGKFNKAVERQHNPDLSSSESEDDEDDEESESSEDDEDLSEADLLIKAERKEAAAKLRAERKQQRKAEEARTKQMAERRRSRDINLNKVGGISNAAIRGKQAAMANMACHVCGQKGHLQKDCPDKKQRRGDKRRSGGGRDMDY